jgi:hypothetical protein
MTQQLNDTSAYLASLIQYHIRASIKHQNMIEYHTRGETDAREELVRIQALQIQAMFAAPLTAEYKDILGNLVARGKYVPETREYVTSLGEKIAHWNAGLGRIVPVPLLRSRLASQNKRADPVAHALYLEQQRQRYRDSHPIVQRPNPFI